MKTRRNLVTVYLLLVAIFVMPRAFAGEWDDEGDDIKPVIFNVEPFNVNRDILKRSAISAFVIRKWVLESVSDDFVVAKFADSKVKIDFSKPERISIEYVDSGFNSDWLGNLKKNMLYELVRCGSL